jgi:uncharacterized protein
MKIVIDSSVWIAGIGSRKGFSSEIIFKSYKNNEVEIFISNQILEEISRNLAKKLKFDNLSVLRTANAIRNLCDYAVEISLNDEKAIDSKKYSEDRHVLALCQKIQADFLITFDRRHLLPLKKIGKTLILEPKDFVKAIDSLGS